MPDKGDRFRDALVREIESWGEEIDILKEKPLGFRFGNTPRTIDILLRKEDRFLGIEAKYQENPGTTYQKLSYTLEDCRSCPIPTIIVFAAKENVIKEDMKSKLILSGIGIEVEFKPDNIDPNRDIINDRYKLFRQRVYIELGIDWFKLYK